VRTMVETPMEGNNYFLAINCTENPYTLRVKCLVDKRCARRRTADAQNLHSVFQNSKSEIRSTKQIQILKCSNNIHSRPSVKVLVIWSFGFVSNFVLRNSSLFSMIAAG